MGTGKFSIGEYQNIQEEYIKKYFHLLHAKKNRDEKQPEGSLGSKCWLD